MMGSTARYARAEVLLDLVMGGEGEATESPTSKDFSERAGAICNFIHLPRLRCQARQGVKASIFRSSS